LAALEEHDFPQGFKPGAQRLGNADRNHRLLRYRCLLSHAVPFWVVTANK